MAPVMGRFEDVCLPSKKSSSLFFFFLLWKAPFNWEWVPSLYESTTWQKRSGLSAVIQMCFTTSYTLMVSFSADFWFILYDVANPTFASSHSYSYSQLFKYISSQRWHIQYVTPLWSPPNLVFSFLQSPKRKKKND